MTALSEVEGEGGADWEAAAGSREWEEPLSWAFSRSRLAHLRSISSSSNHAL